MKRRTIWKIVASFCLIAVLLPVFSALTATSVDATTNAPYPYAMEAYGQVHSGIHSTAQAPTLDGELDSAYSKIAVLDQGSGDGAFVSNKADGSAGESPASEFMPRLVQLYATYDEQCIYFYVEARTFAAESYSMSAELGFDFGAAQTNAQNGSNFTYVISESGTETTPATASGANYFIKNSFVEHYILYGEVSEYDVHKTAYEFMLPWGGFDAADPDRLYFSASFPFDGGDSDPYYWFWGVPNNVSLPTGETIGSAMVKDGLETATFTPNVIELMGEAPTTYTAVPQVSNVIRVDSYDDAARTFRASVTLNSAAANVAESGVLYGKTAELGNKHFALGTASALPCEAAFGTTSAAFDATLEISKDDYNTFYSLRPYVKYADGSLVYGPYYTISSLYFDSANKEYPRGEMAICMIGCSFNYYHLNELVSLAAADGLHLTAANVYRSGAPAIETWTYLVNDDPSWQFFLRTPDNNFKDKGGAQNGKTVAECLAAVDHWDVITVQDHYGIGTADTLKECVDNSMPYLPNVFRYLELNHPTSRLYLHQTWAFQPGYGWDTVVLDSEGNVDPEQSTTAKKEASRMNTVAQQTRDWGNIKACTEYICTSTSTNMIPSGSAWQLARHKTYTLADNSTIKVGDILCNKGANGTHASGDFYHDGTTGGGQYLNACTIYEVMTGYDVRNVNWVPEADSFIDGYTLDPRRAEALRMAAHEAVEACRAAGLTDHYGN